MIHLIRDRNPLPPRAKIPRLYQSTFGAMTKCEALAKKYPGKWFGYVPAGEGYLVALLDKAELRGGKPVMYPE